MPQTATRPGASRTDVTLSDGCSDGRDSNLAQVASSTNPRSGARLEPGERGDVVPEKGQLQERGAFAMFGALTGIATLSAVLVVGGAGLGLLVDNWTSAPHVFVFAGLVLGVLTAVLATRSIVRRFFR
jgi:hypothetical protein